jgi:hypothetical protein
MLTKKFGEKLAFFAQYKAELPMQQLDPNIGF